MKPNAYSPAKHLSRRKLRQACLLLFGLPALSWAQTAEDASKVAVVSSSPGVSAEEAREARLPKLALTPKLLYQTLLAEIAGQRGQLALSAKLYSELLKSTRDPRIAQRAAEVSVYAREATMALEAAKVWVAAEPGSAFAQQTIAGLLLSAGRIDEAVTHLGVFLSIPHHSPPAESSAHDTSAVPLLSPDTLLALRLEQVQRILSRYPDKAVARSVLERLSQPHEHLPEVQLLRARLAAEGREDAAALAAIDRALKLRPDWEPAVLLKAQVEQRDSSTRAEATLKAHLDKYPGASEVRLAYARSLIGGKLYDAARQEFSVLLKNSPDNPEVLYAVALLSLQLEDFPVAEKHLKRLLELGTGNANLFRYYLGQVAETSKQPTEALAWYLKVTPGEQYLPALNRAASLLVRQGQLDQGRAVLQKAAQEQPQERVSLLIAESQLLVQAKRTADAYRLLEGHLHQQPDQAELLYETALLADRLKYFDVLERNLRRLIRIKPDDAHAYNALGYSLADRGLHLDEAAKLIDKGLSLAPEDAFIMDSKGWLHYRRGEHKAALQVLRKAYELRTDPEIAAHLGEVLWVSGQQEEARKTWQAAALQHTDNELLARTMNRFLGGEPHHGSSATAVSPPAR